MYKRYKLNQMNNISKPRTHNTQVFWRITVRVADGYQIVDVNDIIYIEAADSYSKINLANGELYIESKNLNYFENLLSRKGFWRVHKSYMINIQHLAKVFKGPPIYLQLQNGQLLPVSSRRKPELLEKLKSLAV